MSDQPKFYSQNFARIFNNVITVSTGDTNKARLIDGRQELVWSSFGSNDAITETILIEFSFGHTFSAVFLKNINLKNFKVQYWNGTSYVDISGAAETTYAANYWLATFTGVSTNKIKITMTTTQTANEEKKIGELYLCDFVYQLDDSAGFSYARNSEDLGGAYRLASGIREQWSQGEKWLGNFELELISPTIEAALYAIYILKMPFCFIPEPTTDPSEFYEVEWVNTWNARYAGELKVNGKNLTMNLAEV